jgi:phosphoribosylanthranilate isomerase
VSPKDAAKIIAELPNNVEKIGVFVNQAQEIVLDTVVKAGLTGVQLHGDEDSEYLRALAKAAPELRIYRAMPMSAVLRDPASVPMNVAALLLDSAAEGKRGGSGKSFDWDEAAPFIALLRGKVKVVVAGGLTPTNVQKAIETFRPWGVDVVSGVESEPGKKDHEKLRAFVQAARATQLTAEARRR